MKKLITKKISYLKSDVTEKRFISQELGHGMFAKRHILAGCPILEYSQEIISDEPELIDDYTMTLHGGFTTTYIRPKDVTQPGAHLINHSCKPNCSFLGKNNRTYVITNRDILKDEQLTVYYSWIHKEPRKCYCGHQHCFGTIGYRSGEMPFPEVSSMLDHSINKLQNTEMTACIITSFNLQEMLPKLVSRDTLAVFAKQFTNMRNLQTGALKLI